jgi:chromosome segregation ATPase
MSAHPGRNLTPAPPATDEGGTPDDVRVSGSDLLERIERLSAQLALTRARLGIMEKRAAGVSKARSARQELARELERLREVEHENEELREANADLTRQLEGMWFQLRAADTRFADAQAEASKGLFSRRASRD